MTKTQHYLAAATAAVLLTVTGGACADSGRIKNPDNKHYYQRFDNSRGWHAAKAYCEKLGGYLAVITSKAEQDFIWTQFGKTNTQTEGFWLGASDEAKEGVWRWVSGERWKYNNWHSSQPNNAGSYQQHYLFMATVYFDLPAFQSYWGDFSSLNTMGASGNDIGRPVSTLCEWNAEPDVYGQISLTDKPAQGVKVTLKQTGQADKAVSADKNGNYQLKRADTKLPATIVIELPASQ